MNASGNGHLDALHFTQPPQRVVSLVPSMTESLFDLGLGDSLVGITDFCVHPQEKVDLLPRIGGTKNPNVSKILTLQPDLVIANQEENSPEAILELKTFGIKVWITFPKTVWQAIDILWVLVGIFHSRSAAVRLETLELTLDWAESALSSRESWSYFCPIWMDLDKQGNTPGWWMTFNHHTYLNDVLRLMGGQNVFSERERKYPLKADLGIESPEDPGNRDVRYPRVTSEEILAADPEVILLPDEPFPFKETDETILKNLFKNSSAVRQDKVYLVDGSLLSWHGTRLARALSDLPVLLGNL